MLGHKIAGPVNAKCCGYPYNASLRPCFSAKGPGPVVPCRGCERKQEVRLWCGICGKDAPTEAYVGYDHAQAVAKFWADVSGKQARQSRQKECARRAISGDEEHAGDATMKPTRNDTALCLLRLCNFKLTPSQTSRLANLGLMQEGGVLSAEGFVCAYTAMADIQYGGSNRARTVIADAARQEASDWQAEIERRAASGRGSKS